jgi:ATP-binding cassette subfamily B protein
MFKLIINSFKNTKFKIVLYIAFSLLIAYLTTFIPIVIQYFLDALLKESANNSIIEKFVSIFDDKLSFIPSMCILLLLVELILTFITYLRTTIKNKIIQEFQFNIKQTLFYHIQNLTYQDFYKNSLADLVSNMADDIKDIVTFIDKQLTYILDILLILIFAIVQLSRLDIRLSFIMIISAIIMILLSIWLFKKSKPIVKERIDARRKLYDKIDDNYSNVKFVKVNNLQEQEIKRFKEVNRNNFVVNKKKVVTDAVYNMTVANITKVQNPFIFILGTYLYIKKVVSVGSVYVTVSYSNKIGRGFQSFGEMFEYLNTFAVAYMRLNGLLNLTLEENENNIKIINSKIVFSNASIIVNGQKMLADLNFSIEPNDKVLIVGATGSGKSILVKTLVGFYDYEGSITIDGYEVRDLNKKNIRDTICLLLQDSYLFSKTIAENIKILMPYMSDEEMINLSKEFAFHNDVEKMNKKYESMLGKNGLTLSKGQRQRLVLVRAFTKLKPIMIFDDSFSAIDKINKKTIIDNLLNNNSDNNTKIFITHNVSVAPQFEKIIFLDNKKAHFATHKELLNNENYKKLYDLSLNNIGDDYA